MSIKCKFELSRSSNIYYSGEELAGLATICCFKTIQLEAIVLEFYGNSTVQWWELDKSEENIMHNDFSAHEVAHKVLYSQQQKHLCEQLTLGLPKYKELLPHVAYTFKFCFQIPQQIPATYNCIFGQIEYALNLQVQLIKKTKKEFRQVIVIKNKLDLRQGITYKKACVINCFNDFGQINLQIPCSGFTPGQKIPYQLKYLTTHVACTVIIQFNCYTTCRMQGNSNKFKQIKQIINYRKHLSTENSSYVNIPLHCHISNINDPELLITSEYLLEAFLINRNKKVLLRASIPLTIGTTPCYVFDDELNSFMCFNNFGTSSITFS